MASQSMASLLLYRVLISVLLYSFCSEATLSPSLAPHSQHHSHPLIPATPPHSSHHSHPLIPSPDIVEPPYRLLPPPRLPHPHPHHHHHDHDAPPPTNGAMGPITPSTSPHRHHHRQHHHYRHHHHNKQHHSSLTPLPSPYLSPPDFNSPPIAPGAHPLIPHHKLHAQNPAAAPYSHPFKFTSPPPPPRRHGSWVPLQPSN